MTDQTGRELEGSGETTMYRLTEEGGLEAAPPQRVDYRDELQSRRWNAAALENPEARKTDPRIATLALILLAIATLVVLLVGYGLELWRLPA